MPRVAKKPPNRADGRYEKKYDFSKYQGQPKRKSFYSHISFEDCDRQANELKAMLEAHILVGDELISKEATFKEWANVWLEKYKEGKVKTNTYDETYKRPVENYLIPYFGERLINNINIVDIQSFVKKFNTKYSTSVLHKMRLCLNGIFDSALDNHLCRCNPAKKVSFESLVAKSPKRIYTENEVNIIYEYCNIHPTGIYSRILLELGLRCSELCGLKWGDFDFKNKSVKIHTTSTRVRNKAFIDDKTKNKKYRVLPLQTDFINFLEPHQGNLNDYILSSSKKNNKGKPLSPLDFSSKRYKTFFKDLKSYLYDDYMKRLENDNEARMVEITELTPHELRHTCGTLLYSKTKDIYAVSKYLGHSSVEITAKLYVHDSPDLLRDALGFN